MDDEKIIQEQRPSDGSNLDSTVEPEVVSVLDGSEPSGAATVESHDGDVPADGSSDEDPISDESAREISDPVAEPIAAQEAEETSDADNQRDSSGSNAELTAKITQISSELHELHKLYHNEFAGRLKSMQDELDCYHNADRGNAFDGILSAIARIYVNNESLAGEISDPKIRKNVKYMLLDLSDLLEEYGVQRLKSEIGDKRNIRHCQIVKRIPTDDPEKHDTIAASRSTGFYKGNRTIIKELVDVYFFDKGISSASEADTDVATGDGCAEAE